MLATLHTRPATTADIPFLARIEYEASLPPLNQCFWEELLQGTGTPTLLFIAAKLKAAASNWGNVADFLVLSEQGQPVAAAAGYVPNPDDYCPLRLSRLAAIANELNWSPATAAAFRDRYLELWGGDLRPDFLTPQAPWIIENVAVLPEARGRELGKADRKSTRLNSSHLVISYAVFCLKKKKKKTTTPPTPPTNRQPT